MDCSKAYGNLGCKGGFEDAALTYAMDKGIEKEEDYEYSGVPQIYEIIK